MGTGIPESFAESDNVGFPGLEIGRIGVRNWSKSGKNRLKYGLRARRLGEWSLSFCPHCWG